MTLSRYLKKERLNNNLTQREFASKIGINYVTYSGLENAKAKYGLGLNTALKLSNYLRLEIKKIREMFENDYK